MSYLLAVYGVAMLNVHRMCATVSDPVAARLTFIIEYILTRVSVHTAGFGRKQCCFCYYCCRAIAVL